MKLRNSAVAVVILAATTLWGQSSAGPLTSRKQPMIAGSNAEGIAAAAHAKVVANQHLQEMGATLMKMHALLKQMRANTTGASAKDPMAKANLDMWALMLEQLDHQYEELRAASHARDDLQARRAALYKQADEKAAAAAKMAQAAKAGTAAPNSATGASSQNTTTPAPTETNAPPATSSASPN
jgi:hypothetical protein